MPTFNRTFRVVTGIDVANTIILDSNRNLSNITSINSSSFVTTSGLDVTAQANNARTTANGAYAQANSAVSAVQGVYAQANTTVTTAGNAFNQANNARTTANGAYAQANSAVSAVQAGYLQANNAYGQANSAVSAAQGAYLQANNAYAQANSEPIARAAYGQANNAYAQANSAVSAVQAGYLQANNAYAQANSEPIARAAYGQANNAYGQANSAVSAVQAGYTQANNAYGQANTATTIAQNAYAQANSEPIARAAYGQANNAYAQANSAVSAVQGVYALANSTVTVAGNAFNQANNARTTANGAYAQANSAVTAIQAGYAQANSAVSAAQGAYLQANNAYGQANVAGNTVRVSVNSASTLSNRQLNFVNSPKIQVQVTDSGDGNANILLTTTGLVGSGNGTVNSITAGYGLNSFPSPIVDIGTISANIASTSIAGVTKLIDLIDSTDTANAATANAVNWLRSVVNSSYAQANSEPIARAAYAQANNAYGQANNAYGQANSAVSAVQAGYLQANNAFTQANNARTTANGAYAQANSAVSAVQAGYLQANNAYAQANSAVSAVQAGYAQANNARLTANSAYDTANLKLNLTGGTISGSLNISGNLVISGNTQYVNVTTYSIQDPLIYLAANNDTSDLVDIGFMAGKNTSGIYSHTGFVRDATDTKWKLFDGLPEEGHQNNIVNFANTYLATLSANVEANTLWVTNQVLGNVNFDSGTLFVDSVSDEVGIGTTTPQSPLEIRNGTNARLTINRIGTWGTAPADIKFNTDDAGTDFWTFGMQPDTTNNLRLRYNTGEYLTVLTNGNVGVGINIPTSRLHVIGTVNASTYITASGLNIANQANNAYAQANSAVTAVQAGYTQANNAYAQANSAVSAVQAGYLQANNAYAQANNARTTANGAYGQANSAVSAVQAGYLQANNAYAQANSAVSAVQAGYTQANNAYGQANSAFTAANNRVLKAGDTMTGQLIISSGGLSVAGNSTFDSGTLFVDSVNDLVCVGTTSPLTIGGTAGVSILKGGVGLSVGANASNMMYLRNLSDGVFQFQTNAGTGQNSGSIHLEPYGGSVGIGTATPQYRLDVNSTVGNVIALSAGTNFNAGLWSGIHFGYSESASTLYRKSALIFERQDGSARGKIHILNNGNADTTSATLADSKVTIQFDGSVGIGTTSPTYRLEVNGSFAATTKSFVIDHPTKKGHKLRYGSLEGPENGVYLRGRLTDHNVIYLPEYWTKLVDPNSITVTLTPIGKHQKLYVDAIVDNKVIVGNKSWFTALDCFFVVYGERIDVDKLVTEYPVGE